jgi:hypothetical protein
MIDPDIARLYSSYFRMDSPVPYQIDVAGNITYMRWSTNDMDPVFIRRVLVSGNSTFNEYTIDVWSNRSLATYTYNFENMI